MVTFAILTVFVKIGEANYSGIQVDNYYAESGEQGITQNVSFNDSKGNGLDYD